jgi:hypothetical protein
LVVRAPFGRLSIGMARPRTTLLARCAGQFLPYRHWSLLATEPDLPVARLAELQRQARGADEESQRALAREFKRRLGALGEGEREKLKLAQLDREGGVSVARLRADADQAAVGASADAVGEPGPLRARLDAVLSELLEGQPVELTASEQLRLDLLRGWVDSLDSVRARIARDGVTVTGSRGQPRAHPLLSVEIRLARELRGLLLELESPLRARATRSLSVSEILNSL